ncbi:hypothetical protein FHX44_116295 [Pseudonocardia hierapolitana]|uniref:Uncharacterized protein n=1 Tax=Pseudonocardia hierapolitana TaxID=1128676 RepID=A0A561SZR3_9PSEU|nr:hypothetical protein [Pseudonocardia hierapolitana]TWF80352.1 hypothetical protein FHX44_116295 [Pseudonocardia hierapolitana]
MSRATRVLGFPWPVLIGLAALAAPRVVLHDLGLIEEGSFVNGLLVFVPPASWIATVLWKRPRRPFATVVVIGAIYGVFLALGHQLLWDTAFGGDAPALGGELAGTGPAVEDGTLRTAAVISSLVTGTLVGVVTGAIAVLLCRLVPAMPADGTDIDDTRDRRGASGVDALLRPPGSRRPGIPHAPGDTDDSVS